MDWASDIRVHLRNHTWEPFGKERNEDAFQWSVQQKPTRRLSWAIRQTEGDEDCNSSQVKYTSQSASSSSLGVSPTSVREEALVPAAGHKTAQASMAGMRKGRSSSARWVSRNSRAFCDAA